MQRYKEIFKYLQKNWHKVLWTKDYLLFLSRNTRVKHNCYDSEWYQDTGRWRRH